MVSFDRLSSSYSYMESEQKKYEIAYLVSPQVPEEDVVRIAGIVTRVIEESKGMVRHVNEPKKRLLFYPIQKDRKAYFGYTTFTADGSTPAEITKKLKFEKEILRSLITEEVIVPARHIPLRAAWQPTDGSVLPAKQPIRREELPAVSAEERKTAIENIDKQLEEILGA